MMILADLTGALGTFVGGMVATAVLIGLWLYLQKDTIPKTVQEIMATKEGREELAGLGTKQRYVPMVVEQCPECEGYGKPHHTRLTTAGVEHYTENVICKACEGTGLKGGSPDYRNVLCQACEGKGESVGVQCFVCSGTGVLRREKSAYS